MQSKLRFLLIESLNRYVGLAFYYFQHLLVNRILELGILKITQLKETKEKLNRPWETLIDLDNILFTCIRSAYLKQMIYIYGSYFYLYHSQSNRTFANRTV